MGIFGNKLPLPRDEWDWQLASFKWMIHEFGGIDQNPDNQLVLPNSDFFSPQADEPREKAVQIFDRVKELSGMAEWPTKLSEGERSLPDSLHPGFSLIHEDQPPAGEFRLEEQDTGDLVAEIFYNPSHIEQPMALIATFAHELAHYLMSGAKTAPPGGWEIHELTTDLVAVYLGFGIFLANSASNFSTISDFDQSGWKHDFQGYLSADALVCAIALWESLAGRDPLLACDHLKNNLSKKLRKTVQQIERKDIPELVTSIDLAEFAG